MAKHENMMQDLSELINTVSPKEIQALDIEAAPWGINQISCVNGSGKLTLNMYGEQQPHQAGVLDKNQRTTVRNLLKKAKILVGYNISSDITALAKNDINVSLHWITVDIYLTVLNYIKRGLIDETKLSSKTLQGVAEYFGIKNVKGYHDSQVDAKVTMRLFHTICHLDHCHFWTFTTRKNIDKAIHKEAKTMEKQTIDWLQDYSDEKDCTIYRSPQGFYEALVPIKNMPRLIRMSQEEFDMFRNIRKMTPGYPLRVFYLTILAPGAIDTVLKYEKKLENAAKEKTETDTKNISFKAEEALNTFDDPDLLDIEPAFTEFKDSNT